MLTLAKLELQIVAALVLLVCVVGTRASELDPVPPTFEAETSEVFLEQCVFTKVGYRRVGDWTVGEYGYLCWDWSFATDLVPYQTVSFEPGSAP